MKRPQLAVGAIVMHDGNLLMVQRAGDPGKGLWSIPGGRVEFGELLNDALKREVREETGLEIEVGELAGILEVPGTDLHYVILDYHADVVPRSDGDAAVPRAGGDAADARWVTLTAIAELDCTPRFAETMTAWGIL